MVFSLNSYFILKGDECSMALQQTWDLESIFPGGSSSPLVSFLEALEQDVHNLQQTVKALTVPETMEGASSLERFARAVSRVPMPASVKSLHSWAPDRAECE